MSFFAWTTVKCVVCNRRAKKYIDQHAPWVNDHEGVKTICIGCVTKYRPMDTVIYLEHIATEKESKDEKHPKQRAIPFDIPPTGKRPSETG